MQFSKKLYKRRLIDEKIEEYSKFFKCLLIEGPKYV